jgi:hypothetical protein
MISDTAVETAHSIIELCKGAKSKWVSANPQERKALLEFVLSNPVLDGVTLRYDLRKPFSLLAEMKKNPEWRSQLEAYVVTCGYYPSWQSKKFKELPKKFLDIEEDHC